MNITPTITLYNLSSKELIFKILSRVNDDLRRLVMTNTTFDIHIHIFLVNLQVDTPLGFPQSRH